jgi:hypothetical protein
MIIMIAANKMNPTAHPGVSRAVRDADDGYASSVMCRSLLWSAAGHLGGPLRTIDGPSHQARPAGITRFG